MARGEFQRRTRQREVILEELRRLNSHPTAAALYELVRKRLSKVSLGTVYRNLELLARTGTIHRLEFGGEARFDGNVQPHDHVYCLRCGRVDDVDALTVDLAGEKYHTCRGYEVFGHRLEYFGLCPTCRALSHDIQNPNRSENHVDPQDAGCSEQAD